MCSLLKKICFAFEAGGIRFLSSQKMYFVSNLGELLLCDEAVPVLVKHLEGRVHLQQRHHQHHQHLEGHVHLAHCLVSLVHDLHLEKVLCTLNSQSCVTELAQVSRNKIR